MKSITLSSAEDKNTVRKAVPTSKIFTAGVARLHVASPDPLKWTYSQIWGAAAFCIDKAKNNSFFIRLIDLENQRGVIWEQELYEGFKYVKDASFFHTFESDDCLTALEFVDEGEADTFYKKVQGRESLVSKASSGVGGVFPGSKKTGVSNQNKRRSKIDKNHIGMPADFRHVGHIGYTAGKGFSIQNNDPEWSGIFDQLKSLGISADEINDNQEFIQEFLQQNGTSAPSAQQQQPQYNATPPVPPSFSNNNNTQRKKTPPPPPPPGRHHAPPPPPPPRRSNAPPPPPPARNNMPGPPVPNRGGRPVPPPPPGRNNMAPPPPPPPAPPMMGGPPPAPPAPPIMGGAPPPPPAPPMMGGVPPPPSGIPAAAAPAGRSDLMASIRAAGGFGTLKSSGKLRDAETVDRSSPAVSNGGAAVAGVAAGAAAGAAGGDLASSLANVLKQRQQAMQSDDEDDDDDEWE